MSSDDEEEDVVIQPPEFDIKVAKAIIKALQLRGENVLMDELIDAAEVEEWEVARVLDILVSLQLAGIERQRGNDLRCSRAFAYRNGHALPRPVSLDGLPQDIESQEKLLSVRSLNIKRLKEQVEKGKELNSDFLREYSNLEGVSESSKETIRKFLQSQ